MSSETTPKTIELYGVNVQHEAIADDVIKPGMLIERTATGVQANATAKKNAVQLFAVENRNVGNGITVDYAADDNVRFVHAAQGSGIYAIAGAAIAKLAFVTSAGNGKVQTAVATDVIIGQALEAAGANNDRVRIEIISAQTMSGAGN